MPFKGTHSPQNNFQQVDNKLFGGGSTSTLRTVPLPQNIWWKMVMDDWKKAVEAPQNSNRPPQNNNRQIWEIILRVTPPSSRIQSEAPAGGSCQKILFLSRIAVFDCFSMFLHPCKLPVIPLSNWKSILKCLQDFVSNHFQVLQLLSRKIILPCRRLCKRMLWFLLVDVSIENM